MRRLPFADSSTFSAPPAPLKQHRVAAGFALDGVAAVARVPDEGVVAGAQGCGVVASVAVDGVVAVAADQRLDALAAGERVVAGAAVDEQGDRLSGEAGRRDGVVAAEAVDGEQVGRVLVLDRDRARQTGRGHADASPLTLIVSSPAVPLTETRSGCAVARRAAEGAGEVDVHVLDVGPVRSLTVTTSMPPSALKSTVSTPCGVHRDVAGVAEEERAGCRSATARRSRRRWRR